MTAFIKNNVVEIFEKKITQEVVKKILIKDLIVEKILVITLKKKLKHKN